MLFVHNTSRVEDEPYPKLLQEKGFRGFPSICFMDSDGNVLTRPPRTVAGFVEVHATTKKLVDLRAKGDKANAAEQKELFLAELKLDLVAAADIQPRADKLTLTDAEKTFVAQKIVDAEIAAIQAKAQKDGPEQTAEAYAALLAAGKTPSDGIGSNFWVSVLNHASKHKDAALAQRAFDVLEQRHAKEKQYDRARQAWKQLLDDAKAK